jgi:adenosine deaminase
MPEVTIEEMRALPKTELHVHLDCSLSYAAVSAIEPEISRDDFRRRFLAPPKCDGLLDYFRFLEPAIALLQSPAAMRIATLDLLAQFDADNVVYAEIRFAPQIHTQNGHGIEEIVDAVAAAIEEGASRFKVKAALILCLLRPEDATMAARLVDLAGRYDVIVGLDLAGDETGFPLDAHLAAFSRAREMGLGVTAHAGEAGGASNVAEVVERLGVTRVGLGVITLLRDRNVHLEVCPSCNVQIGLYPDLREHPVAALVEAGLSVGINTDARGVTDLSLSDQYLRLNRAFGWTADDFAARNRAALDHAFVTPAQRAQLMPLFAPSST